MGRMPLSLNDLIEVLSIWQKICQTSVVDHPRRVVREQRRVASDRLNCVAQRLANGDSHVLASVPELYRGGRRRRGEPRHDHFGIVAAYRKVLHIETGHIDSAALQ